MTTYEITGEYKSLISLIREATTDEEGEFKEPSAEDSEYFFKVMGEIKDSVETKADNICKFIRNLEAEADLVKAEKDILYKEVERLRKRATACENRVKSLKGLLAYLMEKLDLKKIKTPLFSIGWQNIRESAKTDKDYNHALIPVEYLKGDLSSSAINEAVKTGRLYKKDDPLARGKLFYMENGAEKALAGVSYSGGQTLVVR